MTIHLFAHRYQAGDVVGYGRMSEVYRGSDLRMGRDVAIKVLRADLARDPSFQNRFRREAQNAASLNHPSIVAVYDTGDEQGEAGVVPYIVMEFVDGETLPAAGQGRRVAGAARFGDGRGDLCRAGLLAPARGGAPGRHAVERDGQPGGRGQGDGLRHRPVGEERHGADHRRPPLRRSSARRSTCHRNRPAAKPATPAPTSTPPAVSSTKCSAVKRLSLALAGRGCLPTGQGGGQAAQRADARIDPRYRRRRAEGAREKPAESLPDGRRDAQGPGTRPDRPRRVGDAGHDRRRAPGVPARRPGPDRAGRRRAPAVPQSRVAASRS